MFVSGFATSLRVHRGQLHIRTGSGRNIREGVIPKVGRPRLRRVVIFGKGGQTTWEALSWLDGIGASFALISRSGRVISTSVHAGPDQPALRRAQVTAFDAPKGLEITRALLHAKLKGQTSVVRGINEEAARVIEGWIERLAKGSTMRELHTAEAQAADAYWSAWRDVQITFANKDQATVPELWKTFGDRRSMITGRSRTASSPIGALLNYAYALAEFECRIALLAMGLDPGLGWSHKDYPYRDSAALDVLEAVRPQVDVWVLDQLGSRRWARKDFVELTNGQVRLMPNTAELVAGAILTPMEQAVGPTVESIARSLATGAEVRMVTTRLTQESRKAARVAKACRECGVALEGRRRVCDECLPDVDGARQRKLQTAGTSKLAEMRRSADDPAKSPEALDRRRAALQQKWREQKAWEKANPGHHDSTAFRREVLPRLAQIPVAEIARETGLSKTAARAVRSGTAMPHARHWKVLETLVIVRQESKPVAE